MTGVGEGPAQQRPIGGQGVVAGEGQNARADQQGHGKADEQRQNVSVIETILFHWSASLREPVI